MDSTDRTRGPARRLGLAVAVFALVLAGGTIGLATTQGAGLGDALYVTVMTVLTVGAPDVLALDSGGRLLAALIAILGIGSATVLAITLIELLAEGHLLDIVGRRRMERELDELDDHMIVCGFGRVGRQVADDLILTGTAQVIVDVDEKRLPKAAERGLPYVAGDATDERVLETVQVQRARGLAACTDDDAENILIALTAKLARPDLFVVVRLKNPQNVSKAQQAGADRVITPTEIGGRRIAALLTKPAVVDFLDVVTHSSEVDIVLEELTLTEGSSLVGKTLATSGLRDSYGANVVAIRRVGRHTTTTRPDPTLAFKPGDVLVAIGAQEDMDRLQQLA